MATACAVPGDVVLHIPRINQAASAVLHGAEHGGGDSHVFLQQVVKGGFGQEEGALDQLPGDGTEAEALALPGTAGRSPLPLNPNLTQRLSEDKGLVWEGRDDRLLVTRQPVCLRHRADFDLT